MRILIVGTAGHDFHVFNTIYRDDPAHTVVAFTSADLDAGSARRYPATLSGPGYPEGIEILPEQELARIIAERSVDVVVFAYSEIDCAEVAGLAARVLAAGADFQLINPRRSMLTSARPVVAVTSARVGAGKSPTIRYLAEMITGWGLRVAVVRHPLPSHAGPGTAPTREPLGSVAGTAVFSGPDYRAVLDAAEEEGDVVLWDGAGSDLPFLEPRLHIVVTDPLRADGASDYFPGEVGLRLADAVVISKCDSASAQQVATVERAVRRVNPDAVLLTADSPVVVENGGRVAGRTVVVVEDELTLSLGALRPGAGLAAARQAGAAGVISPLPQAVGAVVDVYARHPEAQSVLPATGYGPDDLADLAATLRATPSEAIIDATRVDLSSLLELDRPVARAAYAIRPHDPERLAGLVRAAIG